MKILVINAGSSSLKYQLIDMSDESVIAKGLCERIGIDGSVLTHKAHGKEFVFKENMPSHVKAIQMVLDALTGKDCGVVSSMKEIAAVGHRVVHGAEDYKSSVLIDEKVLDCCKENIELAPLHNPANIMGIEACRKVMPDTPMVAVFDTAFHATMPDVAFLYGLPYDDYKQLRIRKYGFHGTSHMFVSQEAAKYLGRENDENLKVVTCHLGNGSSVTAIDGGKSVDTSMGFTPLAGLPMGTRSGDIDAGILEYLMNKYGMDIKEMVNVLNKKSGVMGVSGVSSDFRDLEEAFEQGNERAGLAVDMFNYGVKKLIGAYAAAMGGVDAIVFTGGIGEHDAIARAKICHHMDWLGIRIDTEKNKHPVGDVCEITAWGAKVRTLVIATDEELMIARDTKEVLEK